LTEELQQAEPEHENLMPTPELSEDLLQASEARLRAEKDRFDKIAAVAPGVIYSCRRRPDGTVDFPYVSPTVSDLFGLGPDELAGFANRLPDYIHPEDWPAFAESMMVSARDLAPWRSEHRFRHPRRGYIWLEARSTPIQEADGSIVWHGFVTDVTDRKLLEEQLRQAQKMEAIGRLAGGIAHDFNNLLTVINGFSDLLLQDVPPGQPQRERLMAILDAGKRATQLTGQLLAFSRRAIIAPKVLDLNARIDSIGDMLRRLLGEDITLTTVLHSGLSPVRIDPGQMEQVLINLGVNARDAMPRGGCLTIETMEVEIREEDPFCRPQLKPGRHVQLSVTDTGCGMSDEVKAHIFEPFFTTKARGKGTGLGLATVYGIVKQANGHILVESCVGAGTTVRILLPAVLDQAAEAHATPSLATPRGNETVLLVEDEAHVRKLARLCLEAQGYAVLEMATAAEALQIAETEQRPIHLLITDVVMPDLGGRELADAVRRQLPGIKVLYITGYTNDTVIRHGVSDATDALLQKPFTRVELAQKVRTLLDSPNVIAS
jgi:PAS domain S-box-containing protein